MLRTASGTTIAALAIAASAAALTPEAARAADSGAAVVAAAPSLPFVASYADVADLADAAPLIVRVQLRKLAPVPAQATRSGMARFYAEARTVALVARKAATDPALGETVAFLVDLPVDARGRAPALRKRDVLLFARAVPARPGELALVAPDAMLLWSPEVNERLRTVVTALLAVDAPARVIGVRELVNTPGNLAGESETQVFLATADGSAASLTITHAPGRPPRWGASFSELVAATGTPPARDTLAWYRLACFLPRAAPTDADRSDTPEARVQAAEDYRFVVNQLGGCPRLRRPAR